MSSEVKRYDPINSDGTCGICVEDADYGAYVEYADYAALEAENARLSAQLAAIQGGMGEAVEVRGLQWLDTGHYRNKPPQFGYNPHDWNPLMTVAQHQHILADVCQQRDKLAGLLRDVKSAYTTAIHWEDMRAAMAQIDNALSELAAIKGQEVEK